MAALKPVALLCRITLGGFSDERVFRVKLVDGGEHVGVASRHYCYDRSNRPLGLHIPAAGQSMDGKVAGRLIRYDENGRALVSVPDGEVLIVNKDQVTDRPKETAPDVPVQS